MDDENRHIFGQMTDSKTIKSIIAQKNEEKRGDRGMGSTIDDWMYEERAEAGKGERAEGREAGRLLVYGKSRIL